MLLTASVYAQQSLSDEKQILKLEDDWARALIDPPERKNLPDVCRTTYNFEAGLSRRESPGGD